MAASADTVRLLEAECRRMEENAERVKSDSTLACEAFEECRAILADAVERVQEDDQPALWLADQEREGTTA